MAIIEKYPPTSHGDLIWASPDSLRCVLWNRSATFNVYERAAVSSTWRNVDAWTTYDVTDEETASKVAATHMEED